MRAPELSYYPAELTDEELALLTTTPAQPTEQTPEQINDAYEAKQSRTDLPAALGTVALAFTGGVLDTPPLDAKVEQNNDEPTIEPLRHELGSLATALALSRQFNDNDYSFTAQQTSEVPARESAAIEAAADAAYLLATARNSHNTTAQALELAGRHA